MLTSKISPVKHVRECRVLRRGHELSIHAGYSGGGLVSSRHVEKAVKMEAIRGGAYHDQERPGIEGSSFRFPRVIEKNRYAVGLMDLSLDASDRGPIEITGLSIGRVGYSELNPCRPVHLK